MSEYEYGSKDISARQSKWRFRTGARRKKKLQDGYRKIGIYTAAADYGGDFINSVTKIVERAVVSAKREGVIGDSHLEQGAR